MMTLEEAIKHCKDVALSCTNKECALEHFQLLKWLQEYSNMLKKQGEQKIVEWHREDEQNLNVCLGYIPDELLKRWLKDVIHAKYDKLTDKVEPKFKDGDWIIFNGLTLYINEVVKGYYRTISKGGIINSYDWDIDNVARLWTLNEAKDGDVLVSVGNQPFIYNGKFTEYTVGAYCGLNVYGVFVVEKYLKESNWTNNDNIRPATKEQRDILMKEIHRANFKWDADKKELKNCKL